MLNAGGLLGLIHTEMGVFFLKVGQNLPMPPENLRRVHHLIVIVHPAPLPEHPAIGLINLGHRQFPGGQRLHLLPGHLPVLSVGDGGPQPMMVLSVAKVPVHARNSSPTREESVPSSVTS